MRVLICGECYSQNLGDGVITLALKGLVGKIVPDSSVRVFDISGRDGFVTAESPAKSYMDEGLIRSWHRRVYAASDTYATAVNQLRYRFLRCLGGLRGRLAAAMVDVDYVLIGGGQLLQDNHLTFPQTISSLVDAARQRRIPISFFSVGVGENWSVIGRRLVKGALMSPNVESIICRDQLSADRLRLIFPEVSGKIGTTYDVALATPVKQEVRKVAPIVGLCIIHPNTLRWTIKNHPRTDSGDAARFWVDTYQALSARGLDVEFFTNGSPEDDAFAREITRSISTKSATGKHAHVGRRPQTPEDLLHSIAGFGVIIAYRLHANIVATVLGIPCIALQWDAKVEEFMKYSGQSERFVRADVDVSEVVDMAVAALHDFEPRISTSHLVEKITADLGRVLVTEKAGAK